MQHWSNIWFSYNYKLKTITSLIYPNHANILNGFRISPYKSSIDSWPVSGIIAFQIFLLILYIKVNVETLFGLSTLLLSQQRSLETL